MAAGLKNLKTQTAERGGGRGEKLVQDNRGWAVDIAVMDSQVPDAWSSSDGGKHKVPRLRSAAPHFARDDKVEMAIAMG